MIPLKKAICHACIASEREITDYPPAFDYGWTDDYDGCMAKAEITKRTLAAAMKRLLHKMPYEKVSVSMIADEAKMNRKSFYYHFKGKSDLVNWILDTEFKDYLETTPEEEEGWEVIEMLVSYMYKEKEFYCSILLSTGYGMLSSIMHPVLISYIKDMITITDDDDPILILAADCLLASIFRWLLSDSRTAPDAFVDTLRQSILRLSRECIRNLV